MQDFEKLGVFYLGREYDLGAKKLKQELVLYDPRDLVTHAVVVGMTGSGKTGLCIGIIEEAAIDGVPSILIDPKGDLTNLLLTFPQLRGEDFLPWVNPDDAKKKGLSLEDFAKQQADFWTKGLKDWGEDGERIQRLRDAAEFVIYTPGSNAGIPVSILKSFAAPDKQFVEDGELFQERISTTVTSLLGLLNIEADPLQSREHILLSTLIGQLWQQGQDVDLANLITQIQNPPITKIGVLDIDSFYPPKERFSLVMALNNLLASPGFNSWLEGVPIDIGEILFTEAGKPRVAIFSIAHLGDAERMFFVSILLNQVLGWMRTQPGTTSLRALLYMDEIFGYFPPVANPPSKQPLLTMLKQARAFGLGVVLATQNPVDLDYKGLSNTGTWFLGRLQTERDKNRVIEGLEGAAATTGSKFNRKKMEQLLAGLGSRIFLMNNVHEDAPVVFNTRWALSYLRGPLTRTQIKQLMDPYRAKHPLPSVKGTVKAKGEAGLKATSGVSAAAAATAGVSAVSMQPTVPPDVPQYFVPVRDSDKGLVYQPMLIGAARVRFSDTKKKVEESQDLAVLTPVLDQAVPVDWEASEEADIAINDLEKNPKKGVSFLNLPTEATKAKNYASWSRDFSNWIYGSQKLELFISPSTGMVSKPGESERDFRIRLQQGTRENRDDVVEALRKKYATKVKALETKIQKAQIKVDREASQAANAKMQTAVSVGATLLGAITGRKLISQSNISKVSTAARGVSRSMQQQSDVSRAKEELETYQKQLEEMDAEFKAESEALVGKMDPAIETLETVVIKPRKSDIEVLLVALAWTPFRREAQSKMTAAY